MSGEAIKPFSTFLIICLSLDIFLSIYILHLIEKIKSCKCDKDWKRAFIKTFVIVSFIITTIWILLLAFAPDTFDKFCSDNVTLVVFVGVMVMLATSAFGLIMLDYIAGLRRKCECDEVNLQTKMALMSILLVIVYVFLTIRIITYSFHLFNMRS